MQEPGARLRRTLTKEIKNTGTLYPPAPLSYYRSHPYIANVFAGEVGQPLEVGHPN